MRPTAGDVLATKAIQYAPSRLKRLVPQQLKKLILQFLSARRARRQIPNPISADSAVAIKTPNRDSDIAWLSPYYSSAGLGQKTSQVFATLKSLGHPVYETLDDAKRVADIVRASGLFDEKHYASVAGDLAGLDPILHYVVIGEHMGLAPSHRFDPTYYNERYPIQGSSGLLEHYVTLGKADGFRPVSLAAAMPFDRSRIDPQRETVLVISHEASRTGAPILGYNIVKRLRARYNVVTLLLGDGEIFPAFEDVSSAVIGPLKRPDWHPAEAEDLVRRLVATYELSYAIANSIDTRIMMEPLANAFVPVIALVHEFASYLTKGEMGRALGWATQTVFSAERVLESVRIEYPSIDNYRIHIAPQGPSELPEATPKEAAVSRQSLEALIRPPGWEDAFLVLGCGTVVPRKGVDLFIDAATAVARAKPSRRIRFVWIGQRLPAAVDNGYFAKLTKQVDRARIGEMAAILGEIADVETAYRLTDAFFLSSRLDPLPNVAIDSALRALPVVCFENCSGISDILATDPVARASVVPHLDTSAAAKLILNLASDEPRRQEIGAASRRLAEASFNMERYIARLDSIGREAMEIMAQRRDDFRTIAGDDAFDMTSFLGLDSEIVTREDAIRLFLAKAATFGAGRHQTANFYYRRPCPGFHPQIYAHENRERYDTALFNPLAHFIRSGKPAGLWTHEVINPERPEYASGVEPTARAALHVHFHYPELCADLFELIGLNRSRCDLLLTTNSRHKANLLRKATAGYDRGDVQIIVVPNRGRDIGAFLTGLSAEIVARYEFVGHLHSKRSLFLNDSLIGERWRKFIWSNLIGQRQPMMDVVLARMTKAPDLGIVFPDDPHLSDWDHNLKIAQDLAQHMGIREPLPPFFNFPIGTMFWARTAALMPLFDLRIDWERYPEEPVPIDGTILHALERLLPFAARHAGYRYATTHLPGVTW
jgi:glycosyltransferase involved in cell wall biosynthesis